MKFYCEILGMQLCKNSGRISLKFGSQKINLHKFEGEFLPSAKYPKKAVLIFVLLLMIL
ncbi:hypothetical protein [Campylobacter concisus]|uniref:hypothetical protein n=1 Tax=Campylobacter concisus TaxID=199 RepID=UPI003D35EA05